MTFDVTVSGAGSGPKFSWAAAAAAWADEVQPLAQEALRRAAPVAPGPGGGALRDSIRSERTTTPGTVTLTFTARVPYADYVLDGTAAHIIEPRNARALHWVGPNGSVFAHRVNHPGTRPNPFPRRALSPLMAMIQARLEAAVAEQFTES